MIHAMRTAPKTIMNFQLPPNSANVIGETLAKGQRALELRIDIARNNFVFAQAFDNFAIER